MTTAVAVGAWSFNHRLRSNYSAALFRVRNWGSNVEVDIGTLADGSVDLEALTTACQSASAFVDCGVVTAYDQSNGAHDLTQVNEAKQPRIASAQGLCVAGLAGLLAPCWDGVDDTLERADTLGLSGDVQLAISILVEEPTPIVGESVVFIVGGMAGRDGFAIFHETSPTSRKRATYVDVAQSFTTGDAHVDIGTYQFNHTARAAGMQMQDVSMSTNGVALMRDTGTNTTVMNMAGTQTAWGSAGEDLPQQFFAQQRSGAAFVWSVPPTGAELRTFNAWMVSQL